MLILETPANFHNHMGETLGPKPRRRISRPEINAFAEFSGTTMGFILMAHASLDLPKQ